LSAFQSYCSLFRGRTVEHPAQFPGFCNRVWIFFQRAIISGQFVFGDVDPTASTSPERDDSDVIGDVDRSEVVSAARQRQLHAIGHHRQGRPIRRRRRPLLIRPSLARKFILFFVLLFNVLKVTHLCPR